MRDFFDGSEVPNTLWNLCTALQRRRDSYLAQAIATDVELYEQSLGRPKGRVERSPDLVEFDLNSSLLMGIHEVLQQVLHFAAAAAPKKAGKAKVKPLPRPKTAKHLYDAVKTREAVAHIESVLKFVPQAQFEETIAKASGGEQCRTITPETPSSTFSRP